MSICLLRGPPLLQPCKEFVGVEQQFVVAGGSYRQWEFASAPKHATPFHRTITDPGAFPDRDRRPRDFARHFGLPSSLRRAFENVPIAFSLARIVGKSFEISVRSSGALTL